MRIRQNNKIVHRGPPLRQSPSNEPGPSTVPRDEELSPRNTVSAQQLETETEQGLLIPEDGDGDRSSNVINGQGGPADVNEIRAPGAPETPAHFPDASDAPEAVQAQEDNQVATPNVEVSDDTPLGHRMRRSNDKLVNLDLLLGSCGIEARRLPTVKDTVNLYPGRMVLFEDPGFKKSKQMTKKQKKARLKKLLEKKERIEKFPYVPDSFFNNPFDMYKLDELVERKGEEDEGEGEQEVEEEVTTEEKKKDVYEFDDDDDDDNYVENEKFQELTSTFAERRSKRAAQRRPTPPQSPPAKRPCPSGEQRSSEDQRDADLPKESETPERSDARRIPSPMPPMDTLTGSPTPNDSASSEDNDYLATNFDILAITRAIVARSPSPMQSMECYGYDEDPSEDPMADGSM